MELHLKRVFRHREYTIGKLFINDVYETDCIEDCDRGLKSSMTEEQIRKIKVYGKTCIPSGRYKIDMETISPKFSKQKKYQEICEGKLPRLVSVPGFDGILIHILNSATESLGCIGVGTSDGKGRVLKSTIAFKKLYAKLKEASDAGEEIWITIE